MHTVVTVKQRLSPKFAWSRCKVEGVPESILPFMSPSPAVATRASPYRLALRTSVSSWKLPLERSILMRQMRCRASWTAAMLRQTVWPLSTI